MKIKYIVLFGVIAALSSCSTAYRSGQTPDDVYYSPAPVQSNYVNTVNDQDRNSYSYRNDEESQIRSGIQNPAYRTPVTLDLGYGYNPYSYNPYSFGSSMYGYDPYGSMGYMGMYNPYMYNSFGYSNLGLYSPYSFYSPYNSFYSPYGLYNSPYYYGGHYSSVYYPSGNTNTTIAPRRVNLNAYNNNTTNNSTSGSSGIRGSNQPIGSTTPTTTPSAPIRRTTGVGNVIRRVFTPSENRSYNNNNNSNRTYNNSNNNNNNNQAPSRSFDNSPSVSTPSSSGSSNSNSSAPVRTFRR